MIVVLDWIWACNAAASEFWQRMIASAERGIALCLDPPIKRLIEIGVSRWASSNSLAKIVIALPNCSPISIPE